MTFLFDQSSSHGVQCKEDQQAFAGLLCLGPNSLQLNARPTFSSPWLTPTPNLSLLNLTRETHI